MAEEIDGKIWPQVERVLIYRIGSLGDTVVALPSLHLAARAFPNAERRILTNFPVSSKAPAIAAVLGDSGLAHGYIRYAVGTRSVLELVRLWWTLLMWRPQVLVYLVPVRGIRAARRDAWFFRLCGIVRQVGVPITREMQEHASDTATGAMESESHRLARNIAELGDAAVDTPAALDLRLSPAELTSANDVLAVASGRTIVAVSIGTKLQSKDWGEDNWKTLLSLLGQAHPDHALVLLGAPEEAAACEYAAEGWRQACLSAPCVVNLCGVLTPRQSAAVLRQAAVFIGHDSGPMHLAAAAGTICVAIFSARTLPGIWFPPGDRHRIFYRSVDCMGCGLETCIEQRRKCLTGTAPGKVAEAVEEVLALTAHPLTVERTHPVLL